MNKEDFKIGALVILNKIGNIITGNSPHFVGRVTDTRGNHVWIKWEDSNKDQYDSYYPFKGFSRIGNYLSTYIAPGLYLKIIE